MAGSATVHSTLIGIYKVKKKVRFMSVGTKLLEPVMVVGLSERECEPIQLSCETYKVQERKPGKAAMESSDGYM